MQHYPGHLIMGVAALAATLALSAYTLNRHVRRKLKLSAFLLVGYVLAHAVLAFAPSLAAGSSAQQFQAFERLAFAAALINLFVIALINPLRADRIPDGFPAILQDAVVIAILVLVSTFFFQDQLITTSAVGAVVVGFALQDTLGNAFAGLAIQSEKPFRVGHWIRVGEFEGRVAEVTWRATKLRTKTGNFVIVPNNIIAKEAITNYSEPVAPTRLELDVGASYLSTPAQVQAALREALAQVPRVLDTPPPDALLYSFDDSAITYRVRFWVANYEFDDEARHEVRTAIFYAFGRHGIEIPYPIEVGYSREWPEPDAATRLRERERMIADIDLFSSLTKEQRAALATSTTTRVYGDGERIVRQGEPGHSMYVVCAGRASVVLEPDHTEVAAIERGDYFGEMSLLTGEPRTATVLARGDVMVLEIDAELFRRFATENPAAVEQIGVAAMTRREQLDQVKAVARGSAVAEAPATFISRMKRFLGLAS
jgi:small-conductance mechanosensitive channel/CRP-like cAMP-binding protein